MDQYFVISLDWMSSLIFENKSNSVIHMHVYICMHCLYFY